ncbi:MAG TPA: acyl-CoA thioesterase domain-containing protein [Acidimicrobiales bacterium]|nr:acyl-CoA thioesterase domain-containing protein [Acidimicrobiales bacterium]
MDEAWSSLQGVHGGVVAAVALAATERELHDRGVDASASLRAATLGYVAGNVVGDLTVEVDTVRRGRSLVTSHARVTQQGKTTTVARFHHSPPWNGMTYSDAPPMPERPAATVPLQRLGTPAHINNVETHLHPDTTLLAGADRAEWIAWSRPLETSSFDAAWLLMFGDYFPPAVFARATTPQRAVTIEYSIQIHSAAGTWDLGAFGYLAVRMHAFHSHAGFAVEDGWIYLPDGELLATTRQTRLAG